MIPTQADHEALITRLQDCADFINAKGLWREFVNQLPRQAQNGESVIPTPADPRELGLMTRAVMNSVDFSDAIDPNAPWNRRTAAMDKFVQYRRKQIAELRPYEPGERIDRVSISAPDKAAGSPKLGDMIARNPKNHDDQWLVAAQYFADNFEPIP